MIWEPDTVVMRVFVELIELRNVLHDDGHAEAIAGADRDLRDQRVHPSDMIELVEHQQHLVWLVLAGDLHHHQIMDLLKQDADQRSEDR
ncbi:hypothetical protein QU42_03020 [Bradyrhizobium sp. UASWS1016]|nr:hypothetical protein QU42_03020 [Bradyrhizobium sp. UASWS1016]